MNVDESTKRDLLEAARAASTRASRSRAQADEDAAARRRAVRACMEAGIPRQEIASVLGVSRQSLYRLVSEQE